MPEVMADRQDCQPLARPNRQQQTDPQQHSECADLQTMLPDCANQCVLQSQVGTCIWKRKYQG